MAKKLIKPSVVEGAISELRKEIETIKVMQGGAVTNADVRGIEDRLTAITDRLEELSS